LSVEIHFSGSVNYAALDSVAFSPSDFNQAAIWEFPNICATRSKQTETLVQPPTLMPFASYEHGKV
jgi:hypothetical protein